MKPKVVIDQELALKNLIKKYEKRPRIIHHCVYKLSYAGKFVIVKGKTLIGSLDLVQKGYSWFRETALKPDVFYMYPHFYKHIQENPQGRFRVKILSRSTKPYYLLKREQMEIDRNRYNPNFLNNATEAYIPKYNEKKGIYGTWIDKVSVMGFRKYLKSPTRKQFLKNIQLQQPKPAMRVL